MAPGSACRICSGDVKLRIRGRGAAPTAAVLSPSHHAPGGHGDLFACVECGTVQQPALPAGAELHDLYRDMRDDAYLGEEQGRRATAARLLDLIAPFAAGGRLLDVGCGPGLLLDEARRRGYETVGLELSRASAAHARDALGLDVRELALEDFPEQSGFDVVVLADVLEHLDDPVGGVARCAALLRPGGVLCVVTPDPSSPRRGWPARAGGATSPPTPACCRARRCASCLPRRASSCRPTCRSCARSPPGAGSRAWPSASGRCARPSTPPRGGCRRPRR